MNTSIFDEDDYNDDYDDEYPRVFCHDEEMKNLSAHLYLQHQGALNGRISGDDPCEDSIIGISPKVFSLLMLARFDLVFRPIAADPNIGVLLELETTFGRMCVYSKTEQAWNSPYAGSEHLGFSFLFENISNPMAGYLQSQFPDLKMVLHAASENINVAIDFKIEANCYLYQLTELVYRWLMLLQKVETHMYEKTQEH